MSGRLALLVAVAAACGQAGCTDREVVGGVVVKSVLVMAASGAYITVSADEDPVLAGMWLRIPPGSLPRDLTVTIERGGQDIAGTAMLPAGPVVILGPAGTLLALGTTVLGLPVTPGTTSDGLFIEVRERDGRRATVRSTTAPDDPGAQVVVDRFAAFQAVRLRPGAAAPDGGLPPPPSPPPSPPRDAR